MKLLTMSFDSAAEFLAHHSHSDLDALFFRSKTELDLGERVVMEVRFPSLVEPVMTRGRVVALEEDGSWIGYEEAAPKAFLVAVARGELSKQEQHERTFPRLPVDIDVVCRVDDGSADPVVGKTVDLGPGGAFVQAERAPEVGARVRLVVPEPKADKPMVLFGNVAWRGSAGGAAGFGVRFSDRGGDNARLRHLVRKSVETGQVVLAQPGR